MDPAWPKDMQPTGKSYCVFKDGVCVAIGMQFSGKKGERDNVQTLREFAKGGGDIQTLPHDEACAALKAGLEARKKRAASPGPLFA
jgi:hypothetical protein